MKESYDLVLTEQPKGLHRLLLASTEEQKAVVIPEFYERDAYIVRKTIMRLISRLIGLLEWVNEIESK